MPKSKLNSKKYPSTIRSNSPNRIITLHNCINDIINKFENSQKTCNRFVLDTKQPMKYPNDKPSNYRNNLNNSSDNFYSSTQTKQSKLKQRSWNKSVLKMVDSISDDVIENNDSNVDGCGDGGVATDDIQIDNDQMNSSMEMNDMYGDSVDPNIYDYMPLDTEPILPPTKFMRLKNINIVRCQLNVFQRFVGILLSFPFFASVNGAGLSTLTCAFFLPRFLCENILYPVFRLILGTLYPAYASYKAVRNKDVKDYLKWIMYWIVFAFFTCFETFTDIFLSWFPFYYELKVVIVIWLLSPVTEGSSVLYRNFVHPMLTKREKEIDEYINQAKEKGCSAVLQLGSRGMNYATTVIMQTALKGGGNLVSTLKKSYSLSDLSEPDMQRSQDEVDEIVYGRSNQMVQYRQIQPNQRYMKTRMQHPNQNYSNGINRSSSTSRSVDIYYDDRMTRSSDNYDYIRSSEDISSGYSSTVEPVSMALSRTSSLTNAPRFRTKSKRTEEKSLSSSTSYSTIPRTRKTERERTIKTRLRNSDKYV